MHHPLALESGLSATEAAALRASERAALACARHVIATSAATARLLASDYGVPPERLSVVEPGTDRSLPTRGSARKRDGAVALLAVGAVVPRKGYDVLIAALARLDDLPGGSSSPATAREARRRSAGSRPRSRGSALPIASPCSARSTAEQLAALYAAADLFVLPSRFEGYGMAYAEAIAHGVPVVGTTAGAIPDTVPADAGVLVPPDDVDGARRPRCGG